MSARITRKKGQSGRAATVHCVQYGEMIPRDKAIEKRKRALSLDRRLREELKKKGVILTSNHSSIVYYCISCAKHRRYV